MTDNNTQNNLNLQQTVRFFETLLRASADGIVITDTANNIVFVNDTFCKYFSSKRHDVIETNLFIWLAKLGHNAKDIWKRLETHINEHGIAKDVEFEMKTGDMLRYFSVNSSLLDKIDIEEAGLIISIWRDDTERRMAEKALKQAHDELEMRVKERTAQLSNTNIELEIEINERKRAEEALQAERDNLERIFVAMIDGVYIVDKKYDIRYLNPVLEKEFGPNDGRKCYQYFHDRTDACPWCRNKDVFAGKTVRWEWYSPKNDRTYDLIDTPLMNPDGTIYKLEMFRDITERKKAEKDLEEAIIKAQNEKNKSESIIAALGDAISIQDTDFKVLYQNKIHQEIAGDQKGRFCYREYEHRDNICDGCPVNRSFRDGKIHNEERSIIKDGQRLYFDIKSSPLRDSTGKIIAGIEIGRDVTERKQEQAKLKDTKNYLDTIIKSSYDSIFVVDEEGRFEFGNEAFINMMGYPENEIVGHSFMKLIHPDYHDFILKRWDEVQRGEGKPYEVDIVRKDGTVRSLSVSHKDMEVGGKRKYCVIAKDITERKNAEDLLKRSEENYRTLVETIPDYVMRYDRQYHHIFANSRTLRANNMTAREFIGKTHQELGFDPLLSYRWEKAIDKVFETGQPQVEVFEWEDASGATLSLEWRVYPEYTPNGNIETLVGISRDITERKRAEKERMQLLAREHEARAEAEATRKLDQMKSMFLASTSHELRTPLNSIIGFTSLMLDGISGELNPEQKEQLGIVHSSGKHLLALINDIIDLSQMEAGRKNVEVSEFNLGEVVEEAFSLLNIILKEKKLELKVNVGDILMKSDRRRLLQCFMNLLGNAIKYTEKGSVEIIAKLIDNNVEISVIDTGIGIKSEDIPKLFGPFVRLQSPLTSKTSGTGLGLYLVKKLATDFLGGDVDVKSEYGKGSTFTLHVPVELERNRKAIYSRHGFH
ncbi:MAG: PAS domain S-box protein [Candidatus Methanoperedens sp.]|nr:PAS domain S-box protein [Candidatus Methanoperedens sp.]